MYCVQSLSMHVHMYLLACGKSRYRLSPQPNQCETIFMAHRGFMLHSLNASSFSNAKHLAWNLCIVARAVMVTWSCDRDSSRLKWVARLFLESAPKVAERVETETETERENWQRPAISHRHENSGAVTTGFPKIE